METSYGLTDTTAPQTTMITLTGSRLMVHAMFMLLVKAWKPVLTTISPQSNTHQMVMNFGFAITMVPPMVMMQGNPSRQGRVRLHAHAHQYRSKPSVKLSNKPMMKSDF